ncbi:DNA repair protein rad50 [Geranomyces michiganensis]|nr:DNA repair protein rad50 [Geranomyces michiganensis]
MACTRSLSLTVGRKTVSQKTLESLLVTTDENGHKTSLSTKCAELDREMPMQLGVLSAILENVIFCHQEDSYWPLSEPATLKKKFDEIFAATAYTKVLDNIKTLRKEKAQELRHYQQEVNHLAENKKKAEEIRQDLSGLEDQLAACEHRVDDIDGGEITRCEEQLKSLESKEQEVKDLQNELFKLTTASEQKREAIQELEHHLRGEEFEESDEVLRQMLDEHDAALGETDNEEHTLSVHIDKLRNQVAHLTAQNKRRLTEHGGLLNEKSNNAAKLSERDTSIRNLASQYRYEGFTASSISKSDVERFMAKLETDLQQRKIVFDAAKFKYTTELSDNNRKLQDLKVSQADIERLQKALATQERKLTAARNSWDSSESEKKERELKEELEKKERAANQLRDEIKRLNAQADERASLSLRRTDKIQKEQAFNDRWAAYSSQFEATFGQKPDPNNLQQEARHIASQKQTAVQELTTRTKRQIEELSGVKCIHADACKQLENKTLTLNDRFGRVRAVIGDEDFFEAAARLESAVNEKRDKVAEIESMTSMYQKFISSYASRDCCPLCDRGFDGSDGDAFGKKLRERLAKVPVALENAKRALITAEQKRDALLGLRTVWDDAKRLEQEVQEARRKVDDHKSRMERVQKELDNNERSLSELEREQTAAQELHEEAKRIAALQEELSQLSTVIENLEQNLSTTGSTKTRDEVQQEEDDIRNSCSSLRRDLEQVQNVRYSKQLELNELQESIREARNRLEQSRTAILSTEQLRTRNKQLEDDIRQLRKDIESSEASAAGKRGDLAKKEEELERLKNENKRAEKYHNDVMQELEKSKDHLYTLNAEISGYAERGGDVHLERCIAEIKAGEEEIADVQQEIEALHQNAQVKRDLRSNYGETRRNIDDTLRVRSYLREYEDLQSQIAVLREQIGGKDHASLVRQLDVLKRRRDELRGERGNLQGEANQLQAAIRKYQSNLTANYRDVDQKYHTQLKILRMQEMANADLDTYARALDNAIMTFHSRKMEEINKIIRELWVNTYQGSDIDTIEIRSDNENLVGNRSYNYRVVMLKGDTPLDMRGRCSAGQKVLTCLIIRLALAETFCLNCGVLALDEPTTNLDRDNIESLAESLANIIKLRRGQANFQLIIITHDEEFMRLLGRSEYADYFWRISKDEEYVAS